MNSNIRGSVFWVVLVVVVVLMWNFSNQFQAGDDSVTFSEFVRMVDSGQVESVRITGNEVPVLTRRAIPFGLLCHLSTRV